MTKQLKQAALRYVFQKYFSWRVGDFTAEDVIVLDYPVDARPRYPLGTAAHPELLRWFEKQRNACLHTLGEVKQHRSELERIADTTASPTAPHWNNTWFSALDAMVLHALLAERRPARIVEVGSGNSTKFMADAIRAHSLTTELTSIDPHPRSDIDALCNKVIRQPMEQTDCSIMLTLKAGDVLFVDNSHRCFTNSDVTAFFLDVLPGLASGVILHIHDIFLPWDYPVEWAGRYYSEQYLLACWILSNPGRLRLVMANAFASFDQALAAALVDLFPESRLARLLSPDYVYGGVRGLTGTSLWLEVV